MELQHKEYKVCPHIQNVENYCLECKIFFCDECTMDHMPHLNKVEIWNNIAKDYIKKCQNCQNKSRLILKTNISFDSLKVEILGKIDQVFDQLIIKLNQFKTQFKDEYLGKMNGIGEFKIEEVKDQGEFKSSLEKLNTLITELKSQIKSGEKKILIGSLQDNVLEDIEKHIDIHQKTIVTNNEYAKELKGFQITENFTYTELMKYLNIQHPIGQKMVNVQDLNLTFPNGSKIWKKIESCAEQICCPQMLPPTFKIRIRINNYPPDQHFAVGICKVNFVTYKHEWNTRPWLSNQWLYNGYTGDLCSQANTDIKGNAKFGRTGAIVSLIYDTNKILVFEVDGVGQSLVFQDIQGPFYFWASIYHANSELEILDIKEV